MENANVFRNLVFEGGGITAVAYCGVVNILEKEGILPGVVKVAGTSSGAIAATLVAIGYSATEARELILKKNFDDLKDDSFFFTMNVYRLLHQFGWYKGDALKKWCEEFISKKMPPDTTFQQLYDMPADKRKELYIVGANLTRKEPIIFSHKTHPDMKISDALRISASIPYFFKSIKFGNEILIDGGVYYNYPLDLFDNEMDLIDKERKRVLPGTDRQIVFNKETLGFKIDSIKEILSSSKKTPNVEAVESFRDFTDSLIIGLIDIANMRNLTEADWHRTVLIDNLYMEAGHFSINHEEKLALMESGEVSTKKYLEWFRNPPQGTVPLNK